MDSRTLSSFVSLKVRFQKSVHREQDKSSLADLDEPPDEENANVLLLRFGVINHVLQTAAVNERPRIKKKAQSGSSCRCLVCVRGTPATHCSHLFVVTWNKEEGAEWQLLPLPRLRQGYPCYPLQPPLRRYLGK
eukprot:jgi/Mesen1/4887/ME000244S04070